MECLKTSACTRVHVGHEYSGRKKTTQISAVTRLRLRLQTPRIRNHCALHEWNWAVPMLMAFVLTFIIIKNIQFCNLSCCFHSSTSKIYLLSILSFHGNITNLDNNKIGKKLKKQYYKRQTSYIFSFPLIARLQLESIDTILLLCKLNFWFVSSIDFVFSFRYISKLVIN